MVKEEELRGKEADAEFKQELFLHDRKLYFDLTEREKEYEDVEMQQITPMSSAEMEEALDDMSRKGLIDL